LIAVGNVFDHGSPWVQDKQKMTIVEPSLYSQRFQAYISSILV
jgi:hypothetical protein